MRFLYAEYPQTFPELWQHWRPNFMKIQQIVLSLRRCHRGKDRQTDRGTGGWKDGEGLHIKRYFVFRTEWLRRGCGHVYSQTVNVTSSHGVTCQIWIIFTVISKRVREGAVAFCNASLTFNNATFCPHSVFMVLCGSQNKQRLFPYTTLTGWFL